MAMKVFFSILWSFRVFNSICKRAEAKGGDTCTTFPDKSKEMAKETIDLVHTFCEVDEYSRQLPVKKDYVRMQKGVHKQKWLVLCNLHELFVGFQEHTQYVSVLLTKTPFC